VVAEAVAAIAVVLLGWSGISKVLDPDPTTGALDAAGLPSNKLLALMLGVGEIASAALALALSGLWLVPAGVLYVSFAVFTLFTVKNDLPVQSCGCFGKEDTPPSVVHVIFNAVSAFALLLVGLTGGSAVPRSGEPAEVILYLTFALIGAYVGYVLLAILPRVQLETSS
jgi:uncharacterized membrane protein YphA (DoxX/SURF4 family)